MQIEWQDIIVYIIVTATCAYAGYKAYLFFKSPAPACASCCKDCPYAKKKK